MKTSSKILTGLALLMTASLIGFILLVRFFGQPTTGQFQVTEKGTVFGSPVGSRTAFQGGVLFLKTDGQDEHSQFVSAGESLDLLLPLIRSLTNSGSWRINNRLGTSQRARLKVPTTGPFAIQITIDHQDLRLKVADSKDSNTYTGDPVEITLEQPAPLNITCAGQTSLAWDGLDSDSLTIASAGQTALRLSGRANAVSLQLSGQTTASLGALQTDDLRIDASGKGSLTAHSQNGSVSGQLSGAVDLTVTGHPASLSVQTSGASTIHTP